MQIFEKNKLIMATQQVPPQYIIGSDSKVNDSLMRQKTKNSGERDYNE